MTSSAPCSPQCVPQIRPMHVVATAGHVDHGKSTLVRALTGMEPDRWAEERRRGLTLDLGFAWTTLPDGETVAFVDVPGHQRFLGNMLAGVGPVPAVLFVVAADEGWSRQSEEHLVALDALGVRHGLLAVTRSDLADPGPATAEALDRIAASSLGAVAAVAVSGATGAGLDDLQMALAELLAGLPVPRRAGPVRFWIDRSFRVAGAGSVVTGTLGAGSLAVGDELELGIGRERVRVRNLQSLGEDLPAVAAVARVAVNIRHASGGNLGAIERGSVLLTVGTGVFTDEVDVAVLGADTGDLATNLVLHVGSAAVPVRVRMLDGDDPTTRFARLGLDHPLALQRGERGVLRDPGGQRVAAGVIVADLAPPPLRRRGAARARAADLSVGLDPVAEVARRAAVPRRTLALLGILAADEPLPTGLREVAGLVVTDQSWRDWADRLRSEVTAHAKAAPLEPGLPLEAARQRLGLLDVALVPPLAAAAGLVSNEGRVRLPNAGPAFAPAVRSALEDLRVRLQAEPFAAPEADELAAAGLDAGTLAAAAKAGLLLRLPSGVVLLPDAEEEAIARLSQLDQPFTASEARQALNTTRRVAIPLLEFLDGRRRTRRVDASRRTVVNTQARGIG
jgi:selenocysteine-specific elongation factor